MEDGKIQLLESQQGSTGEWQMATAFDEEYVFLRRLTMTNNALVTDYPLSPAQPLPYWRCQCNCMGKSNLRNT